MSSNSSTLYEIDGISDDTRGQAAMYDVALVAAQHNCQQLVHLNRTIIERLSAVEAENARLKKILAISQTGTLPSEMKAMRSPSKSHPDLG